MISYLIIDDEPIAHGIIENYCENLAHLSKAGNCYNAKEAMEKLYQQDIDLIFLDINMPEVSGFDLLKSLTNSPKVIVTSAYQEYALEGFNLDVVDYLLKPFSFQRFMKAVNKATDLLNTENKSDSGVEINEMEEKSVFFLKEKGSSKIHKILGRNIIYVEASGNYSKVILESEIITTHQKISDFEEMLSRSRFIRIHKSFIVSIGNIKSIEGNMVELSRHSIPIGQTYKKNVLTKLGLS